MFTRRADSLLTREERAELVGTLASNPLAGDLIPGTGASASYGSALLAGVSAAGLEWCITC